MAGCSLLRLAEAKGLVGGAERAPGVVSHHIAPNGKGNAPRLAGQARHRFQRKMAHTVFRRAADRAFATHSTQRDLTAVSHCQLAGDQAAPRKIDELQTVVFGIQSVSGPELDSLTVRRETLAFGPAQQREEAVAFQLLTRGNGRTGLHGGPTFLFSLPQVKAQEDRSP